MNVSVIVVSHVVVRLWRNRSHIKAMASDCICHSRFSLLAATFQLLPTALTAGAQRKGEHNLQQQENFRKRSSYFSYVELRSLFSPPVVSSPFKSQTESE